MRYGIVVDNIRVAIDVEARELLEAYEI